MKTENKEKKELDYGLISLILTTIILVFIFFFVFFYGETRNIKNSYISVSKDYEDLKIDYKKIELSKNELEKINKELTNKYGNDYVVKLEKENQDLKEELKNVKDKNEIKLYASIKVISMENGNWNLTKEEKDRVLSMLNKEQSFYEIIPIVDNKNYANDPYELKQLGLSRKRASLAVTLLRSLNPKNKIFLSTEVIISEENERGFIINQYR